MFEESARNGYLPSMFRAGSMSLDGDGVPRDIDKARGYLSAAADGGYMFARRDMALGFIRGTFGRRRVLAGVAGWVSTAVATVFLYMRYRGEDDRLQ